MSLEGYFFIYINFCNNLGIIWRKLQIVKFFSKLNIFMDKANETEEEIGIRLNLSKELDQPLYDYFQQIKEDLGLKTNTEVARICIKKAYEYWFNKD